MVSCKSLSFTNGSIEPLFCTLSIYDLSEKKKVTESFSFHLNSPQHMQLVQQNGTEFALTTPTTCIFNLPRPPNENHFFVFQVTKIFKGETLDKHMEIYTKPNIKKKDSLVSEIHEQIKYFVPYQQFMLWGAVPVFRCPQTVSIPIVKIPKGADFVAFLEEMKKVKLKSLGVANLEVKVLSQDEEPPGRLDPCCRPVLPLSNGVCIGIFDFFMKL